MKPRVPIHAGSVAVAGLLVADDAPGLGARLVSLAAGGVTFHRSSSGWVVRFPRPLRRAVDGCPGLPLTSAGRADGVLTSAPLLADELAHVPAGTAIVLVVGGEARCLAASDLTPVDALGLLDLDDAVVVDTEPLGAPPPEVADALPPKPSLALVLGVDPPVSNVEDVRAALLQPPPSAAGRVSPLALLGLLGLASFAVVVALVRPAPGEALAMLAVVVVVLVGAYLLRARVLAPDASPGGAAARVPRADASARPAGAPLSSLLRRLLLRLGRRSRPPSAASGPTPPSLLSRLATAVSARLAALLGATGLLSPLLRRHEQYLQDVVEMFDRKDYREALRHAIPMAGVPSDAIVWGVPRPRDDLSLSPLGGPSLVASAPTLRDLLTRRYERAVKDLEDAGRIEEAAYVIVQLLGRVEEGVAFLERHGRLRAAAQVAEERELPASQRIRLWFLAGERERALVLARRSGDFAGAVALLERRQDLTAAAALRIAWAESLARGGDFAGAVDTVWSAPDARLEARAWVDAAIEIGGPTGARMLARKAALVGEAPASSEALDAVWPSVRAVLDGDEPDAEDARAAFGAALLDPPTTSILRALAAPTVRALLRDSPTGRAPGSLVQSLLTSAGDRALQTDRPAQTATVPASAKLEVHVPSTDRGTTALHDVAWLPRGRLALALGALGVRYLSSRGATLARFDAPASRLVPSTAGTRLLALARAGSVARIARIDLAGRREAAWGELSVLAWADTFDGCEWPVVVPSATDGASLVVLDAIDEGFVASVRHPTEVPSTQLALTSTHAVSLGAPPGTERIVRRRRFSLPTYRLAAVTDVALAPDVVDVAGATELYAVTEGGVVRQLVEHPVTVARLALGPEERPVGIHVGDRALAVGLRSPVGVRWIATSRRGEIVAEIRLDGAARSSARFVGDVWIVWDELGRAFAVDLLRRRVLRDVRT